MLGFIYCMLLNILVSSCFCKIQKISTQNKYGKYGKCGTSIIVFFLRAVLALIDDKNVNYIMIILRDFSSCNISNKMRIGVRSRSERLLCIYILKSRGKS